MGGFGYYVWPAYLITFGIFGFNIFFTIFEKRRIQKIMNQFFSEHHES
jgi:heme exporter protein CcmD